MALFHGCTLQDVAFIDVREQEGFVRLLPIFPGEASDYDKVNSTDQLHALPSALPRYDGSLRVVFVVGMPLV